MIASIRLYHAPADSLMCYSMIWLWELELRLELLCRPIGPYTYDKSVNIHPWSSPWRHRHLQHSEINQTSFKNYTEIIIFYNTLPLFISFLFLFLASCLSATSATRISKPFCCANNWPSFFAPAKPPLASYQASPASSKKQLYGNPIFCNSIQFSKLKSQTLRCRTWDSNLSILYHIVGSVELNDAGSASV